jgi:predicted nucleic acid-binding Zn ribbon protein
VVLPYETKRAYSRSDTIKSGSVSISENLDEIQRKRKRRESVKVLLNLILWNLMMEIP